MEISRKTTGGKVYFIVSDLDDRYRKAAENLYFEETEEGFARMFPATTQSIGQIYQRFANCAEEMFLQAAGVRLPDWETALDDLLKRIDGHDVDWWLTGSTALAIRRVKVIPRDIDLVTTGTGARTLGRLLSDWLIEPLQRSHDWVARWFGRAFHNSRIEWAGEVEASVDHPQPSDFGPTAAERLQVANWHGFEIRVPLLELQLRVSERRGLLERASKNAKPLRQSQCDLYAKEELMFLFDKGMINKR